MQVFYYARVSSEQQSLSRQISALSDYAKSKFNEDLVEGENLFCDKVSGKDFNREQWQEMFKQLRKNDILVVKELDRLGRNKMMIQEVLNELKKRGVFVQILDVPTTLMDLSQYGDGMARTMMEMINNVLIEVFSTIAEQERLKIKQRQAEGIARAKEEDPKKYQGRKPITADKLPKDFGKLYRQWKDGGITAVQFAKLAELNSRTTLYKYIKIYEASLKRE